MVFIQRALGGAEQGSCKTRRDGSFFHRIPSITLFVHDLKVVRCEPSRGNVVRKNLHHEQRSIMLPASVLDALKDMTPAALKVLIYICSCYQGQPFGATVATLAAATGIHRRTVISALNTLREHRLITRISASGNQPNQYGIPLPKRKEVAAPPPNDTTIPISGLTRPTPPAATPTRATTPEQIAAPPSTKAGHPTPPPPTPTQATILELITACYRLINDWEFVQLKQAFPDEIVLRERLERFKGNSNSVGPDMKIGFFIRASRLLQNALKRCGSVCIWAISYHAGIGPGLRANGKLGGVRFVSRSQVPVCRQTGNWTPISSAARAETSTSSRAFRS
jgi:hypothetical protein